MLLFDIGANWGKWAVANQNGNTVIAVEASPITFNFLKHSVQQFNNIIPVNYAVCEGTEPFVYFHHAECDGLSSLNSSWYTNPDGRFYKHKFVTLPAPRTTIDELIKMHGKPSYIKIDVEGAEDIVVRTLSQKIDLLAFEWASEARDVVYRTLDHLEKLGYTKFHVQNEDAYTYMPRDFPYTSQTLREFMKNTKDKVDWGMIFAA